MDNPRTPTELDKLTDIVVETTTVLERSVPDEDIDVYFDVKLALDMGIRALRIAGIFNEKAAMNMLRAGMREITCEFTGELCPQFTILDAYTDQL